MTYHTLQTSHGLDLFWIGIFNHVRFEVHGHGIYSEAASGLNWPQFDLVAMASHPLEKHCCNPHGAQNPQLLCNNWMNYLVDWL